MTLPTIHPDGTPARMLAASAEAAYAALETAYELLRQMAPSLSDYPHERAFALAVGEFRGRLASLAGVMADLEKLIGYCDRKEPDPDGIASRSDD